MKVDGFFKTNSSLEGIVISSPMGNIFKYQFSGICRVSKCCMNNFVEGLASLRTATNPNNDIRNRPSGPTFRHRSNSQFSFSIFRFSSILLAK